MIDIHRIEGYCICMHTEVEHDGECLLCACDKYTELEPEKKSGETLEIKGTNRT